MPKALWQNIFQYLSLEDAVTTSSISKTWLRAWTYFPILEFHFDQEYRDALEILLKSIDDSLLVLKQHPHLIPDRVEAAKMKARAEEASIDQVDVRLSSSDLEAPVVRRSDGDPLMADDFVRRVGNEIFDEDLPRISNVSVSLPIQPIAHDEMPLRISLETFLSEGSQTTNSLFYVIGFRQTRYLLEAEEVSKDPIDVGLHSSDLEALEVRRYNGDPLIADDFVSRVGNDIFDEDLPQIKDVSVSLPILPVTHDEMPLRISLEAFLSKGSHTLTDCFVVVQCQTEQL
ncbi:putative F-box/LRR-repeat protein [Senna tora]|uniref:Putative F-box/LRR-repeat protein n=1 Tax=Senna tora TaxID=362788 RepID=A0A835CJE3_9FABA|nr:putative F-box/LRR-repeat protein [Senna tora]